MKSRYSERMLLLHSPLEKTVYGKDIFWRKTSKRGKATRGGKRSDMPAGRFAEHRVLNRMEFIEAYKRIKE